jgi:hypothetical protein
VPKLANIEISEIPLVPKLSDIWCPNLQTKPLKTYCELPGRAVEFNESPVREVRRELGLFIETDGCSRWTGVPLREGRAEGRDSRRWGRRSGDGVPAMACVSIA